MSYSEKQDYKRYVWQFMLDHSNGKQNGKLKVVFYVKDKEEFERRVKYRLQGFERYSEEEKNIEAQKKLDEFYLYKKAYENFRRIEERKCGIIGQIDNNGKFIKRLLLYIYRKLDNYLFCS